MNAPHIDPLLESPKPNLVSRRKIIKLLVNDILLTLLRVKQWLNPISDGTFLLQTRFPWVAISIVFTAKELLIDHPEVRKLNRDFDGYSFTLAVACVRIGRTVQFALNQSEDENFGVVFYNFQYMAEDVS